MRVLKADRELSAARMRAGYMHYRDGTNGEFLMLSWRPEAKAHLLEGAINSETGREGVSVGYANLKTALRCYRVLSHKFEGKEYHLGPLGTAE